MGSGFLKEFEKEAYQLCLLHDLTFYNIEKIQLKKIGNQKYIFFCPLQTTKQPWIFFFYQRLLFGLFFALFTVNLWRIFFGFQNLFHHFYFKILIKMSPN